MKVSDAKMKYCPLQKQNINSDEFYPYFCDGPLCMMWESNTIINNKYDPKISVSETNNKWMEDPYNGDCGLKSKDLEVNF